MADHTLFERSKGVSPPVFISHVLRNAALPVVTLTGIQLGYLISGTVVIETLFAWPGIGLLAVNAIFQRDYAIVQAVVLVGTAIFVTVNLLVDLSYGWLDPRIRRPGSGNTTGS
jgi:peptide/nickel transport system permease protein